MSSTASTSLTSATAVSSSEQFVKQIEQIQSYYNTYGTKIKPKQSPSFHEGNATHLKTDEEPASEMKQKFEQAKEIVDINLVKFSQDLQDMVTKTNEFKPELGPSLENISCIAEQCRKMNSDEFWFNCENIVQELDDQRKKLSNGALKRAYTNLLFVLTRCTRLVQASKEDGNHQEFWFLNAENFKGQ